MIRHVAIAGAGIGGLAAAIALADQGLEVTLFERARVLGEAGAGLQLSPNACSALRSLGVLDAVRTEAVAIEALRIRRGRDGAVLARLPLGEVAARRFGAPFLVTRRTDLQAALLRRVEACPAIALVLDTPLTGWTPQADGRLRLRFADAARNGDSSVDGLIGADGLHSVVRSRLANACPPARARGTAWRATIDAGRVPPDAREPCSNLWLGPGAHLVHYPVAGGRLVNVVGSIDGASATGDTDWSAMGDPHVIAARFSSWASPVRALIASAEGWGTWPLVDRPALRRWSDGPVTLLGDAAHPMLPFLAQGAAQALEDAVTLAEAVAAVPDDLGQAFRRYEGLRRGRATRVQAESRRQATIYHLGPPASAVRDIVLRTRAPLGLLARYDWLYGPRTDAGRLNSGLA